MKRLVVVGLLSGFASGMAAQAPNSAACDSVIAAAKVGEAASGLFLSVQELAGSASENQLRRITVNVGNEFVAPQPFKMSVFGGPSLLPGLRAIGADTARAVRSPTVTGIYRANVKGGDSIPEVLVIRRSLMDGFDSAAVHAIRAAAAVSGVFMASTGSPLTLDVGFTSDSLPASQRLFTGVFPRMVMKDAQAVSSAPPRYPEQALGDSVRANVVLRFVVGADGVVEPATVEVLRAASMPFLKAAYESLSQQRFAPASVNGCPVAQQVDYPFAFLPP